MIVIEHITKLNYFKVLFRFALAVLKLAETSIIACKSIGAVHASLSRVAQHVPDFKTLAQAVFSYLSTFHQTTSNIYPNLQKIIALNLLERFLIYPIAFFNQNTFYFIGSLFLYRFGFRR